MATKMILVCDIDGSDDNVRIYDLRQNDRRAKVDLCAKCAEPIERLLAAKGAESASPAPRKRASTQKVTTIEEIEARKRARKKD